ncbi:hypothetical protein DFH08DRAFT_956655 [Mycena albidolilacea]|uniref:Uncharacterized protein n=1 Tax=Mycena albidolilacea TaxID=1033008 RepID=A0AAD7ABS4_9AGAR|nr:hypothetical protein DFH08DRAFT_956655 [Mycena albidolilacea]
MGQEYQVYPPAMPQPYHLPQLYHPPPSNILPHPLCAPFVIPRAPVPPSFHQPSALLYHTNLPYHIPMSVLEHIVVVSPVPRVFLLSTASWKDKEKLAYEWDNWCEYSTKVENQLGMIPGAALFLESTEADPNPCPSFQMFPAHHRTWLDMDWVVCAFLSDTLMVTLRYRHLARGPARQISVLKRFANITYTSDPRMFAATTTLLTQCNEVIWQCGAPNPEQFLLNGIILALDTNHSTIASMLLAQPNLDLMMAMATLDTRQCRPSTSTGNKVFVVSSLTTTSCSNKACPKPLTHTWPYCMTVGGSMAGHTIRDTKTKYCADQGLPPLPLLTAKPEPPQVKCDSTGRAYVSLPIPPLMESLPSAASPPSPPPPPPPPPFLPPPAPPPEPP